MKLKTVKNIVKNSSFSEIFLLGQEDAHAIAAIEKLCFDTAWGEGMYRKVLLADRVPVDALVGKTFANALPAELLVFGCFADADLAGYVSIRPILSIQCAEVYNVAVRPHLRGQGWGHTLLSKTLEVLDAMGITEMNLEVRAGNAAAIALYAKNNFKPCGLRKNYYPDKEDALLMERLKG